MKKFIVIGVALCVLRIGNLPAAESLAAVAGYVFDGDTFSAKVNLENGVQVSVRVRIRNIDAPEIHGECESEIALANRAKEKLLELLPAGKIVYLSDIKDDKYLGRIDALAELDGQDLGKIMLHAKLARKYSGGKRQSWCE